MDDMAEPTLTDATHVNGTSALGTDERDASPGEVGTAKAAASGTAPLTPTFLSGLAAAMRETAVKERDRISGVVADDAATHVSKVRSRAAIETEELRRLAEEDVEHIEQWSASEIERIHAEAAKRIDDRRSSLDEYLKQHDGIIETEIQGVDAAVRAYEATLDRFFAELADETDPSAIVRRAGQLPTSPDLDEIRASARANAMARLADAELETIEPAASVEAVATAAEAPAAEASDVTANTADSAGVEDDAMGGVMDDGASSVEPSESIETSEPAEAPMIAAEAPPDAPPTASESGTAETPAPAVPEPVGVMDPDSQRVPNWPAPAPTEDRAQIAPTMDHTSAAVRLLRTVAPWTAPTHAGNQPESHPD